ncbi:hypothetical protein M0805_002486 [Coniferiporia weirii]|nr:hypothetical protein M0805_002486 [Coniferiporia weirii]
MLYLLPPLNESLEGASDENPIHLPQATTIEFAHFLQVFYNPKYSVYDAPMDAWTAILRLAHRWEFVEVRELGRMRISPVVRLVFAERYDVEPDWLAEALAALGNRAEPLTLEEEEELGLRTALRVAGLHEDILRQDNNYDSRRRSYDWECSLYHPANNPGYRRRRSQRVLRGRSTSVTPPFGMLPIALRTERHYPPPYIPSPLTEWNMVKRYSPTVSETLSFHSATQIDRDESMKRRFLFIILQNFGEDGTPDVGVHFVANYD